jgi:hypothetical protein
VAHAGRKPQSLWTDKATGVDRNARSRRHACRYMYSYLQKFIPYTLKNARRPSQICDQNQCLTEFKYGSPTSDLWNLLKQIFISTDGN